MRGFDIVLHVINPGRWMATSYIAAIEADAPRPKREDQSS